MNDSISNTNLSPMRIFADIGAIWIWLVSTINTVIDFNLTDVTSVIQFIMSILGVIWLIVRIYNSIVNDRLDRQIKRRDLEKEE
jgi:hypothetical protein